MTGARQAFDPKLDLRIDRTVDVGADLVWNAWTDPEQLMKWYAPRPWTTVACEIDLRPGGIFRTVLRSPEGWEYPYVGCYLEIIPRALLVWTLLLGPGFRPQVQRPADVPPFTAVIAMDLEGSSTRYTALAMHEDPASKDRHDARGFHSGWTTATDQLVESCRRLRQ